MPKSTNTQPEPSADEIRTRAYLMWEADGRPEGRAEHYWMQASAAAMTPPPMPDKPKARKASRITPPDTKVEASAMKPKVAKAARTAAKGDTKSDAKLTPPDVKARAAAKKPSKKAG